MSCSVTSAARSWEQITVSVFAVLSACILYIEVSAVSHAAENEACLCLAR